MHISAAVFQKVADKDPMAWNYVAQITVGHLEDALSLAACLTSQDLRLRLMETLRRLAASALPTAQSLELPIGQRELGEIAGLSRNVVGRVLAELAAEGIVLVAYGKLTIQMERFREALLMTAPTP